MGNDAVTNIQEAFAKTLAQTAAQTGILSKSMTTLRDDFKNMSMHAEHMSQVFRSEADKSKLYIAAYGNIGAVHAKVTATIKGMVSAAESLDSTNLVEKLRDFEEIIGAVGDRTAETINVNDAQRSAISASMDALSKKYAEQQAALAMLAGEMDAGVYANYAKQLSSAQEVLKKVGAGFDAKQISGDEYKNLIGQLTELKTAAAKVDVSDLVAKFKEMRPSAEAAKESLRAFNTMSGRLKSRLDILPPGLKKIGDKWQTWLRVRLELPHF